MVKKDGELVGDSIDRIGARKRVGDGDGGMAEHRVAEHAETHAPVQLLDFGDEGVHFVNRVVAQIVRGGVR